MKTDTPDSMMLVPREERAILDQIRHDHELLERLGITPQELEALSKCALLGTLTCKEDMLFILRQIREASSPYIAESSVFPQPVRCEAEREEDPAPSFREFRERIRPSLTPLMIEGPVSRRLPKLPKVPKRFGALFLIVFAAAALLWNGASLLRLRDGLTTRLGTLAIQVPALDGWFGHLDRFAVLLVCEALLVFGLMGAFYVRSSRGLSRLKVRPGRGY